MDKNKKPQDPREDLYTKENRQEGQEYQESRPAGDPTPEDAYEEGQQEWEPGQGSGGGLAGKLISPFSDSFESLDRKQKGTYVLVLAVISFIVAAILMVKTILKFV